jgi:hypothetical protein
MAIRILSVVILTVSVLSGCTTQQLIRESFCDEHSDGGPTSRAAKCMALAAYEIAQRKEEESQNQTKADQEEAKHERNEANPRHREWIP